MMKKTTYIVTSEHANERLDVFLVEQLGLSRSQVQKLIEEEQVLVNDKTPKKAGDHLKAGYHITIKATPKKEKPAPKTKSTARRLMSSAGQPLEPKVIAETADYIVIDKPNGLLTHPTMAGEAHSVASWAVAHYPEIKKVGDDTAVRPGIVHRLDKEASGLMVIARTQKMFNVLKDQFKNRTIEKDYYALVHDPVERNWGEINFPLARSESADRMAARPIKGSKEEAGEGEKDARTEFIEEKHFVNFSLLRVTIHTGRMHQIRAHFLAYNHPLVGDPLYNQKKRKHTMDDKLGRLFLHSTKLSFLDLSGNRVTFESPLPTELSKFLETLP